MLTRVANLKDLRLDSDSDLTRAIDLKRLNAIIYVQDEIKLLQKITAVVAVFISTVRQYNKQNE